MPFISFFYLVEASTTILFFPLMYALGSKNYFGFHDGKNMANFDAFHKVISSSINFLFLSSSSSIVNFYDISHKNRIETMRRNWSDFLKFAIYMTTHDLNSQEFFLSYTTIFSSPIYLRQKLILLLAIVYIRHGIPFSFLIFYIEFRCCAFRFHVKNLFYYFRSSPTRNISFQWYISHHKNTFPEEKQRYLHISSKLPPGWNGCDTIWNSILPIRNSNGPKMG